MDIESVTFGVGQDVVDQLPTTTHVLIRCADLWPICGW